MNRLIFFIAIAIIIGMNACDVIPMDEIKKDTVITAKKKVLLEYFTGHACINCPGRSKPALTEIESLYGENVIVMTIHAGFFAIPTMMSDNLDLTSPEGTKLFTDAGVQGVPTGRIDRKKYNNQLLIDPTLWSSAVTNSIVNESIMELSLSSLLDADSILKITATAQFLVTIKNQYNIEAYLLEDSIFGHQLDGTQTPNDVPNYVFMHVFRAQLNVEGGYGLNTSSTITEGSSISKKFNFDLNGKSWKARNCSVVVVVSDAITGESIQVEKLKIL